MTAVQAAQMWAEAAEPARVLAAKVRAGESSATALEFALSSLTDAALILFARMDRTTECNLLAWTIAAEIAALSQVSA